MKNLGRTLSTRYCSTTQKHFYLFLFQFLVKNNQLERAWLYHVDESESCSVVSDSLRHHGLSVEFSRSEYWSGRPFPPPGDLPKRGVKPRSPALQVDSLPAEPQGKPKNTGVGSLSLLQRIFPTQEQNQGLLHCRQILHQLSHQGSLTSRIQAQRGDILLPSCLCCSSLIRTSPSGSPPGCPSF